ncbi:hypothetical protein HMSSN036_46970 [Paenibacillus macerans]|nr:hypothetical protein HMSSN036_46970 [Paenibacillus macerans]
MGDKQNKLLQALKHLRRGEVINEGWTEESPRGRDGSLYRGRWQHDKVVRSTHGVNCTGSCSWNVFVKDGIITWETQQTDYPTTGADFPEYEPRGCPRGASFSWYTYSPLRVKYPYIRGELYEMWREEMAAVKDPVAAWENIVSDSEKRARYVKARGKGGFVRGDWDAACQMIAAATIHTIKRYGPDRVVGFSPIPAMSMVSYSAGTRFLSLIGGTILSFTTGMPIFRPLRRRYGAIKPMCRRAETGTIRNILSSGGPTFRKPARRTPILWSRRVTTAPRWSA